MPFKNSNRHSSYRLYLVTDRELVGQKGLTNVVASALRGGVTAVQIREKGMSTRAFVELGKELKKNLRSTSVPLIVNDRVDVALAIGADGVHIGQNDLQLEDARKILGPQSIVGVTVEKPDQLPRRLDVDYLGVSSIFPTSTKTDVSAYWSHCQIQTLRKLTSKPLIGIGGISSKNASQVLSWGLDGIAVVSALCGAKNLEQVEREATRLRHIVEGQL